MAEHDNLRDNIGQAIADAVVGVLPPTNQQAAWDASQIKQPDWGHVMAAFVEGAREARSNPDAVEADFQRAADGYTKRVFEVIDPVSERALRTGDFKAPDTQAAAQVGRDDVCTLASSWLSKLERLRHLTPRDIGETWEDQYAELVKSVEAVADALARPAQAAEPVAEVFDAPGFTGASRGLRWLTNDRPAVGTKLYAAPQPAAPQAAAPARYRDLIALAEALESERQPDSRHYVNRAALALRAVATAEVIAQRSPLASQAAGAAEHACRHPGFNPYAGDTCSACAAAPAAQPAPAGDAVALAAWRDHFEWWCNDVDNEARHDVDWDDHLAEVIFEAGFRAALTHRQADTTGDALTVAFTPEEVSALYLCLLHDRKRPAYGWMEAPLVAVEKQLKPLNAAISDRAFQAVDDAFWGRASITKAGQADTGSGK